MMFFEGNIAAPPTMTVFSPDISLFILSCALTGATRVAVRASAPMAPADNNAMRFDMDRLPMDGVPGGTFAEGEQRRCRLMKDRVAVAPSYGRREARFQGINFQGFETFRGGGRVLPSLRGAKRRKERKKP